MDDKDKIYIHNEVGDKVAYVDIEKLKELSLTDLIYLMAVMLLYNGDKSPE